MAPSSSAGRVIFDCKEALGSTCRTFILVVLH